MSTQPRSDNPCDPVAQQQRQDDLDDLYRAAGRDRKSHHPMYGLYTGLYREWTEASNAPNAN
jgi:hypothetical protein